MPSATSRRTYAAIDAAQQAAEQWIASVTAVEDGILHSTPERGRQQRSGNAAECGVSVDFLAKFMASIRDLPTSLSSTRTELVVKELIAKVTEAAQCKLIDLVPSQHVGCPTVVVCHGA